jgi:hypothetical protein
MKRPIMSKMKSIILFVILFLSTVYHAEAQYYYRDLLSIAQNYQQHQVLKANKVTHVTLQSFEANGEPTENFSCEQILNNSFTQVKTISNSQLSGKSTFTNYYNSAGQLYRSVDSSNESISMYVYQYDSIGRLVQIVNTANAYGDKTKSTETHYWIYDSLGKPTKMTRIKDNSDTSQVKFRKDSKGNIIEEESFRNEVSQEKVYYYYDSLNRLTDIVRYNDKAKKLLPDYLFDYSNTNQLNQMITVQNSGIDYLTWRYDYDEKGLKTRERCFNKQKQLVGRIEYKYEFRK